MTQADSAPTRTMCPYHTTKQGFVNAGNEEIPAFGSSERRASQGEKPRGLPQPVRRDESPLRLPQRF